MPPYPSTSGRVPAVGVLLAVIAGLLLGGIVGLAIHDDKGDEDDGGGTAAATTSTSAAGGATSSSTSATTAPGGGTSTSTTASGGGTTTPTTVSGTGSTTTVPGMVQGEEETLAHTGAAADAVLLAGLGLGGLALATRRATRRLAS